jgi:hypothetical protein
MIKKFTKTFIMRFTPSQFQKIQEASHKLEISMSEVVRRLLKFIDKI